MDKFNIDAVQITPYSHKHGQWRFAGRDVKGTVYEYRVTDGNFNRLNKWRFTIRVPAKFRKGTYIEVRPLQYPQRKCWANLDRVSINLNRGTKGQLRTWAYAKIVLADPTRYQNKIEVRWDERNSLPRWLDGCKLKRKDRVTTTRGNDGGALVAVIKPDDHAQMIRLYLALKAWVLQSGFDLYD